MTDSISIYEKYNVDLSRLSRDYLKFPLIKGVNRRVKPEYPTKEDIEYIYLELNLSVKESAELFNITTSRFIAACQLYSIVKSSSLRAKMRARRNSNEYYYNLNTPKISTEELDNFLSLFYNNYIYKFDKCNNDIFVFKGSKSNVREFKELKSKYIFLDKIGEIMYLMNNKISSSDMLCYCGRRKKFVDFKHGYSMFCSKYCSDHDPFNTRIKNMKKTNLQKLGVEFPFQSKEILNKAQDTLFTKYGTRVIGENKLLYEKSKKTRLEKYGVESYTSTKEFQIKKEITETKKYGARFTKTKEYTEKVINTNQLKYGVNYKHQQHIQHYEDINREFIIKHFIKNGYVLFDDMLKYYNICYYKCRDMLNEFNIIGSKKIDWHKTQNKIYEILYENNIISIQNDRRILGNRKELDIHVPFKNFAIEYDGLLYHSFGKSDYKMFNNYLDENCLDNFKNLYKHISKTNLCKNKNINLFHIFENEWLDECKCKVWKSIILNRCGRSTKIFARKCIIREIQNKSEVEKFLRENYLFNITDSDISLGLYYNSELSFIMNFKKIKNNHYELISFCNRINNIVIGGVSKLFKYFIKVYNPKIIDSYGDLRLGNLDIYEKLGFNKTEQIEPDYFYFYPEIYNPPLIYKNEIKELQLDNYDEQLSETDIMYNNGFRKIYDCGKIKFSIEF